MKKVWNDLSVVAVCPDFNCDLASLRMGEPGFHRLNAAFIFGAFAQQLCGLFGQVER